MNRLLVTLPKVFGSFVLGLTGLLVYFVAASAVEVPGTSSTREIIVGCLVGAPFLAFCQFWLASRDAPGFRPKWPTVIAMVAPLIAILPFIDRGAVVPQGIPMVIMGALGILAGAFAAGCMAIQPAPELSPERASTRLRICRWLLLGSAAILVISAVIVAMGVMPPLKAYLNYPTGFKARSVAAFLGGSAVVNLLIAGIVVFIALRPRRAGPYPRSSLAIPAVLALLLAFVYAIASGIRNENPALLTASVLLIVCAVSDLATTALVTAVAVVADNVRAPSSSDQRHLVT